MKVETRPALCRSGPPSAGPLGADDDRPDVGGDYVYIYSPRAL